MVSLNFWLSNVGLILRIHKWVGCKLAQIFGLWTGKFISLGSFCCWCLGVLLGGRGTWVCSIVTFVIIIYNSEGIWKLIWCSHFGCAIQPGVCKIVIWCGGHLLGVFDNIPPVWWDCTGIHIRHGGNFFVKDYMIMWTHSPSGRIPHKFHTTSLERQVYQVHSNGLARIPFDWACASSTLVACI